MVFYFSLWWCSWEVDSSRTTPYLFNEFCISIAIRRAVSKSIFIGMNASCLSDAIEIDMHVSIWFCFFMMVFLEIWFDSLYYTIRLIHTHDSHLITHLMESDIANIKHFIKYASLKGLNTRYVMKFCENHITSKEWPADINHASICYYPCVTVPVEDFVNHENKQSKNIRFKNPQMCRVEIRIPFIDSIRDSAYWQSEPEKYIWECYKKMPMEDGSYTVTFWEVTCKKEILKWGHAYIVIKNRKFIEPLYKNVERSTLSPWKSSKNSLLVDRTKTVVSLSSVYWYS